MIAGPVFSSVALPHDGHAIFTSAIGTRFRLYITRERTVRSPIFTDNSHDALFKVFSAARSWS